MSDTPNEHVEGAERVVSFKGLHVPGEPSTHVMAELDRLREKAERGEITGLAYATTDPAGDAATGWIGEGVRGGQFMIGFSIQLLHHTYMNAVLRNSTKPR